VLLVGVVAVIGSVPAVGPVAPSIWVAVLLAAVVLFRYPVACLMVPILVAPVALREVPGTPGLQVIHLAVLVAIGGVFVGTMTGRLIMDPPPSLIWGGLFIAVVLTSTMVSVDSLTSLKVAINQVLGFVLAVCAALVARQSHDSLHWVLRGWTASALVVLLPALPAASTASDRFGGSLVEGRVQGAFAQPNDFAEFSLMGLAVAWALVAGSRRVADRILGGTGILVSLAGVAVSFSRGAWIAAAALVVIAVILAPRLLPSVAVVGTSLVAFSAGALAASIPPFPALLIRLQALLEGARNPEDDRLLIWRQGLRLFAENPIFGRGPGTFATGSYDLGSTLIQRPYIHSHNVPLTVAAEMGVLALICLIGLTVAVGISCLSALRRLKLTGRNRQTAELAVLGAGLVAIAVHGLVDVVYTNPFLIPLAWLLLGIVAGTCRRVLVEPQSAGDMTHPARDRSPASHR
jgi:O-antigen ligase